MRFVDSHCHLTNRDFQEDVSAVIERARAAQVHPLLSIAVDLEDCEKVRSLAQDNLGVYCSQGVHPHDTHPYDGVSALMSLKKSLGAFLLDPKVVALGETGLDYHYNHSPQTAQIKALKCHIELHKESLLPLIIHSRNAEEDLLKVFKEEGLGGCEDRSPGVIHSFSGSYDFAHECLKMGFYISASGISTFKNAQDIRDVLKTVPLDRLLIETDSPYLAPPPYRGRRNEPLYVREVAQVLGDIHGLSLEKIAAITTDNFHSLFWKVPRLEMGQETD